MMVCIRGDNTTSEYILENGTVDYGQLPAEVLFFLKTAIEEGVELPLDMEELEAALAEIESVPAEIEIDTHIHSGGTATCISPALCTSDDCGQTYGEKDAGNHTGGTEIRDKTDATCAESGYTGDTCCMGCGEIIQTGTETEKDGSTHVGGAERRDSIAASCCNAGYTGDVYCSGCGAMIEKGTTIAATGEHPAAICGANGHHAHDGEVHEIPVCGKYGHCISDGLDHDLPSCGKTGHCISDGLDHTLGFCGIDGHYKCDGILHGDNCKNQDAVEQIPAS